MPREKQVETAIKYWINSIGGYCKKVHSGAVFQYNAKLKKQYKIQLERMGTPDLLACINGKFVSIEVKKNQKEIDKWKKQTTPHDICQFEEAMMVQEAGGASYITYSPEDLEEQLKKDNII